MNDGEVGQCNGSAVARRDHSCASHSTEAYFRAAAAALTMRSDTSEPDMSETLLKRHYGLTASIANLCSEVERTVEAKLMDGRRLILKTSTRPEALDSFRFQTGAIAGLQGRQASLHPQCSARAPAH